MARARILVPVSLVLATSIALGCGPSQEAQAPAPAPVAAPTAPPGVAATPDESFRKEPPKGEADAPFVAPHIQEAKLENGVRVLVVERHDLPIVSFQIVADRGADQGTPGLGAFTGAMLLQGTKKMTALQISDALGALGAQYGAWGGLDSLGVHGKVLASSFPEALDLLGDAMRGATFEPAEIERERQKRLTELARQKDSPSAILSNAVAELLYPAKHPYHVPLLGTEDALKKIGRKDLVAFHAKHVAPSSITVAIAGDIRKDDAVKEVEKVFGDWKGSAASPALPAAVTDADVSGDAAVVVIDRPGATQSHVAATLVGVPRATADYVPILVMNTILGGQFSSRLNLNLREKHAYTYGARSHFDMRHGAGPFSAGGAIVREKTAPAVKEILAELARIRDAQVDDEELEAAKSNLIRRLPGSFETVSDVAGSVSGLAVFGLPLDEYAKRPDAYRAVTKEDVQRVAKAYLRGEKVRIVIVGDAAVIQKDLEALGLGKVEVRKAPEPKKAPAKKS